MVVAADTASRYCALLLLTLLLLSSLGEVGARDLRGARFLTGAAAKPCAEIYIVGQGETLHTIGDKCGDPFIIERNPHIHDPDDVYPGLVIKIVPLAPRQ